MICTYCKKPAALVTGRELHPNRPDLVYKKFWKCVPCEAWVGCHDGTSRPLGVMANYALRRLRNKAHFVFDKLWQSGHMRRTDAYRWLANILEIEVDSCHIAGFNDAMCRKVVSACDSLVCNLCGRHGEYNPEGRACSRLLCYRQVPELAPKKENGDECPAC